MTLKHVSQMRKRCLADSSFANWLATPGKIFCKVRHFFSIIQIFALIISISVVIISNNKTKTEFHAFFPRYIYDRVKNWQVVKSHPCRRVTIAQVSPCHLPWWRYHYFLQTDRHETWKLLRLSRQQSHCQRQKMHYLCQKCLLT